MKYLKQFLMIILVSCVGEVLNHFIPLPIPASIYGLVLMLVLLISKIVPLDSVKGAATFLIDIMPVMFIPAAVGLIAFWGKLKDMFLPFCIITVLSTFLVMIVTGKVSDFIMNKRGKINE